MSFKNLVTSDPLRYVRTPHLRRPLGRPTLAGTDRVGPCSDTGTTRSCKALRRRFGHRSHDTHLGESAANSLSAQPRQSSWPPASRGLARSSGSSAALRKAAACSSGCSRANNSRRIRSVSASRAFFFLPNRSKAVASSPRGPDSHWTMTWASSSSSTKPGRLSPLPATSRRAPPGAPDPPLSRSGASRLLIHFGLNLGEKLFPIRGLRPTKNLARRYMRVEHGLGGCPRNRRDR